MGPLQPRTADWLVHFLGQKRGRGAVVGEEEGTDTVERNPQVPSFLGKDGSYHYTWRTLLYIIIIPDNSVSFCSGIACILQHLKPCLAKMIQPAQFCFVYTNKAALCSTRQAVTEQQEHLYCFSQCTFLVSFTGPHQHKLHQTSKPLRSQYVPKAVTQLQLSHNLWPVSILRAAIPLCNLNTYLMSAVYKIQWKEKYYFSRLCLLEWHSSLYKRWNFQWKRKDRLKKSFFSRQVTLSWFGASNFYSAELPEKLTWKSTILPQQLMYAFLLNPDVKLTYDSREEYKLTSILNF